MIRFLVDAQLPPGLARRLAARGYPSDHVDKVQLGVASDTAIWRYAARTDATLVTKDEDFLAFADQDAAGPQVVWIRLVISPTPPYGTRSIRGWTKSFKR